LPSDQYSDLAIAKTYVLTKTLLWKIRIFCTSYKYFSHYKTSDSTTDFSNWWQPYPSYSHSNASKKTIISIFAPYCFQFVHILNFTSLWSAPNSNNQAYWYLLVYIANISHYQRYLPFETSILSYPHQFLFVRWSWAVSESFWKAACPRWPCAKVIYYAQCIDSFCDPSTFLELYSVRDCKTCSTTPDPSNWAS